MAHEGQSDGVTQGPPSPQRSKPSRAFIIGSAGAVFFAVAVTVAGLLGASHEPGTQAATAIADRTSTFGLNHLPLSTAPVNNDATDGPTPAVAGVAVTPDARTPATASASQAASPTPTTGSTATAPTPTVGDAASATPTIGDSWTATPAPTAPATTTELTAAAATLADQIETTHGVRIVRQGQDWGDGEQEQLRNLTAISTALQSVPANVRDAIVSNGAGELSFLSNYHGRTEGGWQPYGDRAANYYTNEDQGPGGNRASNQVVLQPGSTAQTAAHEMMHAFQMRNIGPGDYVRALLEPEMKSFMAATGWTQLVTDDELRASASQSWEAVNQMFQYNGRALSYVNEYGSPAQLFTPNPIEAFAEAGGLYYAHSPAMELPDWAEYWAWFAANLG